MANLIVRVYDSSERAREAAAKLREKGFRDEAVFTVQPDSAEALSSAIVAGRRLGYLAAFYAERVRQGRSLVAVEAAFGEGQLATAILDGCGPVDQELERPKDPVEIEWGQAAPLSAAMGWRVLDRNQPAPLSEYLQLPTLTRRKHFLTRKLASSNFLPSGMFGPLLSRNPAPLSSRLGLPLLSRNPAPLSSRLGLPLLSRNPAPLSSALGLPLLSRSAAPLSSALGSPALADDRR